MTKTIDPEVKARREALKKQKEFGEKKARMVRSWIAWTEFYKELSRDMAYCHKIHKLVSQISQIVVLAKNKVQSTGGGLIVRWDEARNRVLTFDVLNGIERMHGKSHSTIYHDVARVASHASWMAGIGKRGEYGMLAEVTRELREVYEGPKIQLIRDDDTPIVLNAAQINDLAAKKRAAFQKIQEEFLAEDKPATAPGKTALFGFVADVDRQARQKGIKRKPRKSRKKSEKSWRYETD